MTKLLAEYEQDSLKPAYAQSSAHTMILTFDLVTWFLFMVHCLVMIITCAKQFSNPTMYDVFMGQARTSFTEAYA